MVANILKKIRKGSPEPQGYEEELERSGLKSDVVNVHEHETDLSSQNSNSTLDETKPLIDIQVRLTPEELARRETLSYKLGKFFWDSVDKHPDERKFLFKLDFFLLSSAMLGYFIKTLNQNNIATAYVNGMNEYYEMEHNQYNTLTSLWTAGYVIGQIPSNLILHRISARYYLGGLELIWSILTICMVSCKTITPMYGIRFLVGLTESGFFPAMEYLIGSWYSPAELSKRSSLFACSGVAAGMVSGPIQQAVLEGVAKSSTKYQLFQWLFIVDAIISFPVAFYTMLVDPNTPSTSTAWYFSAKDKLIAQERRRRIGAQLNTREKYTFKKIKSFFTSWHIYVFPLIFLAYNNSCAAIGQPTFTTWMKYDLGLSPKKYNTYPTALSGAGIAATIIISWVSDYNKNRWNNRFVYLFFICMIIGCSLLSHWDLPIGLHWFCYFLIGIPTSWGQPQIFCWVNKLLRHDDMKRNFIVVCTNCFAYITGSFVPIFVWDTRDQPEYHIGFTYTACLSSFGLIMLTIAAYLTHRDEKRGLYFDADKNYVVDSEHSTDTESVVESIQNSEENNERPLTSKEHV